jgi:hypothetical protein
MFISLCLRGGDAEVRLASGTQSHENPKPYTGGWPS